MLSLLSNIDFTNEDLTVSKKQLKDILILNQHNINVYNERVVPFDMIYYYIGELHYQGRVTDENDKKILLALLKKYINAKV